jgi:D-sedoheptulose 7-phosphate isomerase
MNDRNLPGPRRDGLIGGMSDVPKISSFLDETKRLLDALDRSAIADAKEILVAAYHRQSKIYTVGNGGSASTAQHFACDLAKYVIPDGHRPFDVRCLTDNPPLYTAWANDAPREDVFVNLMRGLLQPGDVVMAISVHGGSGFSADLVRAVRYARQVGAHTIALVGFDGGILHRECNCSILVPVESTPQTEAIHVVIQHLLVQMIREELAQNPNGH